MLLFDDAINRREYVSWILCNKVGLSETEAYSVMMTAHKKGVAVVGVYNIGSAEVYCQLMRDNGLKAEVKLIGSSDDD